MTPLQKNRYRLKLQRLQSLCGENYARLARLLRACDANGSLDFNLEAAGHVHLSAKAAGRYTTDMQLEQSSTHPLQASTRLRVRLYHDVRAAEVIEMPPYSRVGARHHYPNASMHQPDEKHQWNSFLSDWLHHLEACGKPQTYRWQPPISRPVS